MRKIVRTFAGRLGLCVAAGIILPLAGIGVFLLLYALKSLVGIDLFPDAHLRDFLSP